MTDDLLATARAWADDDPHAGDRAEIEALIEAENREELGRRFAGPLTFGTAGLRGPLRAGPSGMNAAVVTRAAAGLARYLSDAGHAGGGVVIGFDARRRSDEFAHISAAVLAGAGFAVQVLPKALPTPVLSFAVRHLGCVAGVMVTASHNPPDDNGYKVFLGDGAQLVPPADRQIENAIAAVGPAREVQLSDDWLTLGHDVQADYVAAVVEALEPSRVSSRGVLVVAYTAMHGVGAETTRAVFAAAGLAAPHGVPEQDAPDPTFRTVAFPNPEEPGATDLLKALAARVHADVAIAHDPDADRCAVVCGGRQLTGDEVGALLADWLMRRGVRGTYASSLVSGSLMHVVAGAAGQPSAETPTGFKWIIRAGSDEAPLVFGYEEALGYAVTPSVARDKDGMSASLAVALLAAELKAGGRTLLDRLDELATEHGLFVTGQLSVRVEDLSLISDAMTRLRSAPPASLLGREVAYADLALQEPPVDAVRLLGDGVRVIVRPSGTEPKLKAYLETVVPVHEDAGLIAARGRGEDELDQLRAEMSAALGL
jgi:phosphomannomutase